MRRRQQKCFTIILVGKSILLREGLARILRSASFRILASVSCADDLVPSKLQLHQPLFLVIHTGDDCDAAVEQVKLFRNQYPGGRIAFVADHCRLGELLSAFRAGANGYFVDVMTCDVFIKSMELVMMGEILFPPAFLSFVLDPEGNRLGQAAPRDENDRAILLRAENTLAPQLSTREKLILRCLIEGDSNKCIARKIAIAEATVKVHVKAILRKIRVQNRTQAAIWGMNHGSLVRTANGRALSAVDAGRGIAKTLGAITEMEHTDEPAPLVPHASHVAIPPIDGLLGKGGVRGAGAAVRLYK